MSDEDIYEYAVNFAAELLCLRDQFYTLTNDVVLSKDDLNDLLSAVLYVRVVFIARGFFFFLFLHSILFLYLVIVCIVVLIVFQCLYFLYEWS